jgi:parvulin-like peptidyl-prolyl isomerase
LLLALPCAATATAPLDATADFDVRAAAVAADLGSRHTVYLNELKDDAAAREEYVKRLEIARRMESALIERGLAEDQRLLEGLRLARERLILDALVRDRLEAKDADIAALAEERYLADPGPYKIRKKIKVAVILIAKDGEMDPDARARIEAIVQQLADDPDDPMLFQELAKQHSDDRRAAQGGVNDKWLIAPLNLEERDPLMQAAFAMDTVGEVTDIVETPSAFAIAQLLAVTPEQQLPFSAVEARIADAIRKELYEQTRVEVMQSLTPDGNLQFDDEHLKQLITDAYAQREKPEIGGAEDEARE